MFENLNDEPLRITMSIFGPLQFSTGDQGPLKWRFRQLKMKTCPACGAQQIVSEKFTEGCRFNGDAYGTTVFTCSDCSWKTSFQFDDSSDDYYYEKAPIVTENKETKKE
jgi:RNase P subunit RPR2